MAFCGQCSAAIEPGDKFCRNCGAPVASAPQPATEERRLLTVVFVDLVGSTQLSSELDPEEMRELIQLYQNACGQEISRFGGYTAQYLGDGILVYFGYPSATEDTAEQAVRCALAMRQSIGRLSEELRTTWGVTLALRIGVHSGLVVIGDMGAGDRTERLALGEAPNVAARVQGLAEPNEVLISDETRKLIHGRFLLSDRGTPELKGIESGLALYAVEKQATDILKSKLQSADVPIFGRDDELDVLNDVLVAGDQSGVESVYIEGEAGSGKSQLLRAFLAKQDAPVTELFCSEHYLNTPYWPFSVLLEQRAGLHKLPVAEWQDALAAMLAEAGLSQDHLVGLLTLLVASGEEVNTHAASARQATVDAINALLCKQSGFVVCEDMHWADASTRELLASLPDVTTPTTVRLVQTTRPRRVRGAEVRPRATHIRLDAVDRQAAENIVRSAVAGEMTEDECSHIIDRAAGLPMFLVELARQREQPGKSVPTSLHSVLLSQLERVGEARRVAQEAAVLGIEFTREELAAISLFSGQKLDAALDTLEKANVVNRSPLVGGFGYRFCHALMHEVALGSLLKKSRTQLHRRFALYLQERALPNPPDRQMISRLAHHWGGAVADRMADRGDIASAVRFLMSSAESSLAIAAYREARLDLELLESLSQRLPEGPERDEIALSVYMTKCVVHLARAEFASPEVEAELVGAKRLCIKLDKRRELAQVQLNLWMMYLSRGNYPKSLKVATASRDLALELGDDVIRLRATAAQSNSAFWLGDLETAYTLALEVINEYSPGCDPRGVVEHGWDAGVQAYMVVVWSAWLLERDDAESLLSDMAVMTTQLDHAFNRMLHANTAAMLHVMRGDGEAALASNRQQVAIAKEFNIAFYRMLGDMFNAAGLASIGSGDDGFYAADRSYRYYEKNLGGLGQSFIAAIMTLVYADQGDYDRALTVAKSGLAHCELASEGVYKPLLAHQVRCLTDQSAPSLEALWQFRRRHDAVEHKA